MPSCLSMLVNQNSNLYKEMLEDIIKQYCSVSKKKVIMNIINEVEGIEVDDNGEIKNVDVSIENVIGVIEEVRRHFGGVAYFFAKKAIKPYLDDDLRTLLPKEVQ